MWLNSDGVNYMSEKIRIAIFDDHPVVRTGIKMLIDAQPDMEVVGDAADLAELSQLAGSKPVHIAVLDLAMPNGGGLKGLKLIRGKHPGTKAIILTMHNDVALLRSALSEGAAGFVLKQSADTDLLAAIRATYKGGLYIDSGLAKSLLFLDPAPSSKRNLLSDRERQVINLLARGFSNLDIAERLNVSVKTVETYRTRVAGKLGLRTRMELTRYAVLSGLLSPEDFLAADDIGSAM